MERGLQIGIISTYNEVTKYTIGTVENGDIAANQISGNDSKLLIVFYVQIMPDDYVMQLHRF
jgi:hypothetical protein